MKPLTLESSQSTDLSNDRCKQHIARRQSRGRAEAFVGLSSAKMGVALRSIGKMGKTHRLATFDVALLVELYVGRPCGEFNNSC